MKAWAGKRREVGTFKAGSPWKSHGSKQEPPRRPPEQCCQHPAPGVPRTRGHLRAPVLCSRPWHSDPQASVLGFQLLLCPPGGWGLPLPASPALASLQPSK